VSRRIGSLLACLALLGLVFPLGAQAAGSGWTVTTSSDQVNASFASTSASDARLDLENNVSIEPFGLASAGAVLDALGFGGGYSQEASWSGGTGPAISCPELLVDLPFSCRSDDHGGGTVLIPDGQRAELALAAPASPSSNALAVQPDLQSLGYDGAVAAIGIALEVLSPGPLVENADQVANLAMQLLPEAAGFAAAMKRGDDVAALSELTSLATRVLSIIEDHAVDWGIGAVADLIPGLVEFDIAKDCAKAVLALVNLDGHLLSGTAGATVTVGYAAASKGAPSPSSAGSPALFGQIVVHAADWAGGPGVDVYSNGSYTNKCDPTRDGDCSSYLLSGIDFTCDPMASPASCPSLPALGSRQIYVGLKWQCVELAQRLWVTMGWATGSFGVPTAWDIWKWADDEHLTKTDNGSISASTLSHGDLIVWTTRIDSDSKDKTGHVAVVDKVSGSDVLVKEQNWGTNQTGEATYTLKDGWLSRAGYSESPTDTVHWIAGVVHHPASAVTKPAAGGVDLALVIDTTGSMTPYLDGAKAAAKSLVDQVLGEGNARIAVVEYRDLYSDCPIDGFASRVDLGLSADNARIVAAINGLSTQPAIGCDTPESVYSGLMSALGLSWRTGVTKSIVLMGDAPPHDPELVTGYTLASVVAKAKAVDPASIYTIDIDGGGGSYFARLSSGSGGAHEAVSSPARAVAAISSSITTIYRTPIAVAGGPYMGRAAEAITFDGSASLSPVGNIAKYEWDFNGDGTFDVSTDSPTVTYTYDASYGGPVVLRVTDSQNPAMTAVSRTTVSIGPARKATDLVYAGPVSGMTGSSVQFSATLTEQTGGVPVPGDTVGFTLNGTETCTGTTDSAGRASCTVEPAEAAGNYFVTVAFNGSDVDVDSTAAGSLAVSTPGAGLAPLIVVAVMTVALLCLLVFAAARKRRPAGQLSGLAVAVASPGHAPYGAPTFERGGSSSPVDGHLRVVQGGRSATFAVREGQRILFGRAADAGVRVSDPKVGRRQAMIGRAGGIWVVQDLGSMNTTRLVDVSGQAQDLRGEVRIASGRLLVGDTIVILLAAGT
jgi:hypothetical protein